MQQTWISRAGSSVGGWWTRASSALSSAARRTAGWGVSVWVASRPRAERDLQSLARSPVVYSSVTSQALALAGYPIVIGQGFANGGRRNLEPIDAPWSREFLATLQTPGLDSLDLFPEPGEYLIAQLYTDLTTGNAFVAATFGASGPDGPVVGYRRLHPARVRFEEARGRRLVIYRNETGTEEVFDRAQVAHIRMPSWQASGQGQMGQGAGDCLAALLDGEEAALRHTANIIRQGGADVIVTAKDTIGASWLSNPDNREKVAVQIAKQLEGSGDGRRVLVVSGALEVRDSGLKPAEVQAPEFLDTAARYEMMALATTPSSVGDAKGVYANAVQEMRTQAMLLQGRADLIEAAFLGPAARRAARVAGVPNVRQITARIDLSSHPGFTSFETDKLARMEKLCRMGWTNEQAAEHQGVDIEKPKGVMNLGNTPATPGPAEGTEQPNPRRPVGDGRSLDAPFDVT